ncbi:MAG: insulinase family protein [Microvirga sp.]
MILWHPRLQGIVLCLAIAILGPAASAQQGGRIFDIREGRTPRGIRYAFLSQPFEDRVALSFSWWDGFAQTRPGQELLGRLGVAWLQAGTERLPEGQFREELLDDQIRLDLGTGNRTTGGSVSAPPEKLDLAAERLREVLVTPALSEQALARLRRRYASNFAQARETPGTLARSLLIELLADQSPFIPEEAGASLRSRGAERLGRPEVEAWREAVFDKSSLVVAAAGRSTEEAVVAAIDRAFGELPERTIVSKPPDTAFRRDGRTIVIERQVTQTTLVLGAGSTLVWADERDQPLSAIALDAFASGPTSRLFRAVRDELGASYGSTAALPMIGGAARYLVISSAVDPASTARALAVIRSEYDRFRRDGLTPMEFETARARFVNGLEEQARRAGPASALLRDLLRQGRNAAEGPAVLEHLRHRVTREDVNAHVRERWPELPLTTVIVAPSAKELVADCVVGRDEQPERCLTSR